MERLRPEWFAFGAVGTVCLGMVIFGAVEPVFSDLLAALLLFCAGGMLLLAPPHRRPDRLWVLAITAFPLWVGAQLIPLPVGLVRLLSPNTVRWMEKAWPGPLTNLNGTPALGSPPSFLPLSLEPYGTRVFFFQIVSGAILFLAARAFFSPERSDPFTARRLGQGTKDDRRSWLLWTVAILAGMEALYGLLQWLSTTPMVLWQAKRDYIDCASGTLINRNHFALLQYLGIGCALSLFLRRLDQERDERDSPGREMAVQTSLGLLIGLQFAAVLASKSRFGLLGALMALGCGGWMILRTRRRGFQIVAVVLLLLLTIPLLAKVGPEIATRFRNLEMEWSGKGSRGSVARLVLPAVADFPIFGTGANSFLHTFTQYRSPEVVGLYDFAHNDYLQALFETGLIGLLLALAPVVLWGWGWKRAKSTDAWSPQDSLPWPLLAALTAVMLHEFVDFSLQIPALSALVALLAGAFSPPPPENPTPEKRPVVALLALLLVIPAGVNSAARWTFLPDIAVLPRLPDVEDARAREAWNTFLTHRTDRSALETALRSGIRAQELLPLSSRLATTHAAFLVEALGQKWVKSGIEDQLRDQAGRRLEQARQLDPWSTWNRQRSMEISLSLGELDRAMGDAEAVTQTTPERAQDVVDTLIRAGLPPAALVPHAKGKPALFRAILNALLQETDFTTLGKLVPSTTEPDAHHCEAVGPIARTLKQVHGIDPRRFLEGCLGEPSLRGNLTRNSETLSLLVSFSLSANDLDSARRWAGRLPPGSQQNSALFNIAMRGGDWNRALALGPGLLATVAAPQFSDQKANILFQMAKAATKAGRFPAAVGYLEKAGQLNPGLRVGRFMAELKEGRDPFK